MGPAIIGVFHGCTLKCNVRGLGSNDGSELMTEVIAFNRACRYVMRVCEMCECWDIRLVVRALQKCNANMKAYHWLVPQPE